VDIALRRGRHIDLDDSEWFAFLTEAQPFLEAFYRRFGCELIKVEDGYFYLLPSAPLKWVMCGIAKIA
jgi:chromosome partition protein MukE